MGMGISSPFVLEREQGDNHGEITAERIHATITRGDRVWDRMSGYHRSYNEAYAIEFLVELNRLGIEDPNQEADLVAAARISPQDHIYAIRILDSKLEDLIND